MKTKKKIKFYLTSVHQAKKKDKSGDFLNGEWFYIVIFIVFDKPKHKRHE